LQLFFMKIAFIGVSYDQEKHPLYFCSLTEFSILNRILRRDCSKDFENWANFYFLLHGPDFIWLES
jgi:hypothetical protein